jgi:hypothetical protein
MDSNHRFLSQEKPVYVAEGELRGDRKGHQRNLRGTDSSNPSPSSGESHANLSFRRRCSDAPRIHLLEALLRQLEGLRVASGGDGFSNRSALVGHCSQSKLQKCGCRMGMIARLLVFEIIWKA